MADSIDAPLRVERVQFFQRITGADLFDGADGP